MGNYLETIYFRNEQGEDNYPQQLCDHLVEQIPPTNTRAPTMVPASVGGRDESRDML